LKNSLDWVSSKSISYAESVHRNGQLATKVYVDLSSNDHHHERHLPEIERLITAAKLPPRETWSLAVFRQLAAAEKGCTWHFSEQVHFHEVGAVDAIVDIVGTLG